MDQDATRRGIRTVEDVMELLDGLFAPGADRWSTDGADWWDGFYADRSRPVPFFVSKPDENLAALLDGEAVPPGSRALDLGCGPGRNAIRLAAAGYVVDAVDLSAAVIAWGRERAREAGARVRFLHGDVFTEELDGPYRLIHDSGCFHHLPPHRRIGYLALLERQLAPGGLFSLTCFASGGMGSELPDGELYREGGLGGGLAYTAEELRHVFRDLEEVGLRRMREEPEDSAVFGQPFLWTALFRRPPASAAPGRAAAR